MGYFSELEAEEIYAALNVMYEEQPDRIDFSDEHGPEPAEAPPDPGSPQRPESGKARPEPAGQRPAEYGAGRAPDPAPGKPRDPGRRTRRRLRPGRNSSTGRGSCACWRGPAAGS